MKAILPSLALAACMLVRGSAIAQSPDTATATRSAASRGEMQPAAGDPASALLRHVSTVLGKQPSIAAKVRQKVDLAGQAFLGAGIYLQQSRGGALVFRLELALQTGDEPSTIEQVSDGATYWLYEAVPERKNLARVDLARLRRAHPKSPATPTPWLSVGGLPKLVLNLEDSFRFGPVTKSQLDKLPVWTLEGRWKSAVLGALLPDQKSALESGASVKLAPNMPDRVVVYVGCDDFFPYRVEYWRQDGPDSGGPDRGRLLVVMEFYEVRLGGLLDPKLFAYQPQDVQPTDQTDAFLEKLGLQETIPASRAQLQPPRR